MEAAPFPPPMPQPNWFGRNWRWVVPVGCLLPVVLVGGCALTVFFFATGIMKQSDAYKISLARAQATPAVIGAIGSPISQTGIVSGNSDVNGPTGETNLSIPLSGPKGKATLYVEAKKSADTWFFQTQVVKIEKTGERIDLNTSPLPASAASPRASLNRNDKSSRGVAFARRAPSGERTRPRVRSPDSHGRA